MSFIITPRNTFIGLMVLGVSVTGVAYASEPRLVEDKSCSIVTVVPGDNAWNVAGKNGITLDVIAKLNPHISNLSKLYPGDELAVSCGTKPAAPIQSLSMGTVSGEPSDWNQWRNTQEPCGGFTCWTWQAIIIALHDAGYRGNDLITMAAIVPGESNRKVNALGDVEIQTGTWGPSWGLFQIRTKWADKGTGSNRDIERLQTLEGSASAAFEIYQSSIARRNKGERIRPANGHANGKLTYASETRVREPFDDWTCYQLGNHIGWLESVRNIATAIGALDWNPA